MYIVYVWWIYWMVGKIFIEDREYWVLVWNVWPRAQNCLNPGIGTFGMISMKTTTPKLSIEGACRYNLILCYPDIRMYIIVVKWQYYETWVMTYPIILVGERREVMMRRPSRRRGRARRPLVQIRIIRLIHNLCAAHSPHSTRARHIYLQYRVWFENGSNKRTRRPPIISIIIIRRYQTLESKLKQKKPARTLYLRIVNIIYFT